MLQRQCLPFRPRRVKRRRVELCAQVGQHAVVLLVVERQEPA